MGLQYHWRRCVARLLAGAGLLAAVAPAAAQSGSSNPYCPPPPACLPPGYTWPGTTAPGGQVPGTAAPNSTATNPAAPNPAAPDMAAAPSVAPESSGLALSGSSVAMAAPGYVDFAVPISQFRLRFDAAYDDNRPDRAEFFYAKCGCFGPAQRAPGPPKPETSVDYQELRPYLEVAWTNRFSTFIDAPVRFINPEQNANATGFGNLIAGCKYAVIASPEQYLTFQFSVSTPTADTKLGLGNELVGLEPGILYYRQLTDRLALNAELRDWVPTGGTDFEGNILRYGSALSYLAYNGCNFRVSPIGEVVGWTVLSGRELTETGDRAAAGDTIVNAKGGVRFGFGPLVGPANMSRSDLYIGYGRALTGTVWYKDIIRAEYAWRF